MSYIFYLFSSSSSTNTQSMCEVVRGKLKEEHKLLCKEKFYGQEVEDAIS